MKKALIIIIGISIGIASGIAGIGILSEEPIIDNTEVLPKVPSKEEGFGHPEAISSGPLTITQYQHKIHQNIFFIISGLDHDEKGNIRIFMPDGRLYLTLQYDGSKKTDSNVYIKPDLSAVKGICKQDELVGIWKVTFDKMDYPSFEFEIIDDHIEGPNVRLSDVC